MTFTEKDSTETLRDAELRHAESAFAMRLSKSWRALILWRVWSSTVKAYMLHMNQWHTTLADVIDTFNYP
jgi:hypothetical protein